MHPPRKTNFARHLRRNESPAEKLLWQELRGRRLGGYKFRRQVPKDKYVVDFVCEEKRLIVEIDGLSHQDAGEYDENRTHVLESMGYHVIRFANDDVYEDVAETVEAIWNWLKSAES